MKAIELFIGQEILILVRHIVTWAWINEVGDMKKAKFHYEAAAMAGDDSARNSLGRIEFDSRTCNKL